MTTQRNRNWLTTLARWYVYATVGSVVLAVTLVVVTVVLNLWYNYHGM